MTRPYRNISHYRGHVIRRLAKLQDAFLNQAWRAEGLQTLMVGAFVLELDNLIIQALRAYGLMAVREAQQSGRLALPGRRGICLDDEYPSIVREATRRAPSFSTVAYTVAKRDEIKVRDPIRLRTFLATATGHVPMEFQNALALNCQVFVELRDIRHFYAHRCEDTFRRAMHSNPYYLRGVVRHPDEFVATRLPGRTAPKYSEWVAETEMFFATAA